MKKLRIAVWHNLPSGGGKRQLFNHVRGLLERGHYVESWCPETADQSHLPLGDVVKEHIIPFKKKRHFDDIIKPLSTVKHLVKAMDDHCKKCGDEINGGGFDVLYANACMFLRTSAIAGYVNLPSVLYLGEPYRWFYEALPELPWVAPQDFLDLPFTSARALRSYAVKRQRLNGMRYQAREELEFAKQFNLVLVNSRYSRESVLRTYNIEAKVCYLGVDTEYYRPTGEPKENFVVGLGTVYHAKGIDRAIRAIGTMKKGSRPDLIWIGNGASGPDLRAYEALAKKEGVNFRPLIHIPDDEVISVLSRASAMLYTSRLEPFGLAPLEANACGTPVVGIAEGGVRETVSDGISGFLASDDDAEVLGELLARFVEDPALSVRMGMEARKYVESNWNMKSCTDNIEAWLLKAASMRNGKLDMEVLSDPRVLGDFKRSRDIKTGIDNFSITKNRLRVEGWAFINDGVGTEDSEIFLIVKDDSSLRSFRAEKISRHDVTKHFGGKVDYDESGFRIDERIEKRRKQEFGLLIRRKEKMSFTRIRGK